MLTHPESMTHSGSVSGMIVLLRDLAGAEHRLGVVAGRFVDPSLAAADVRDLRHLVAIGGLADCHAHLSLDDVSDMVDTSVTGLQEKMRRNALLQLDGGVLLLAEKGSRSNLSLQFLNEADSNRPQMQMAGQMISVPGGYYPGFAAEIDDTNLVAVIEEAVSGGATWVKIVGDWPRKGIGAIPNFTEDALSQIVAVAHEAGCRVAIHTAAPETPSLAVRCGVDSIEHGLFLTREDVAALGARGGAWVPTVIAMETLAQWLGESSSGGQMFRDGLKNVAALLAEAVDAGVAVLAGTDVEVRHGQVAKEALRLIDYGLSPEQAVHAVSSAAYSYLGVNAGFEPGNLADAVLFRRDPVADPTELLRPALVMRAGRLIIDRV